MEALGWVPGGAGLTHGWEGEALPPADRVPPARPSSPPRPAGAWWAPIYLGEGPSGCRKRSGSGAGWTRARVKGERGWGMSGGHAAGEKWLLIRKRGSWDCWWIGHGVREREESRGVKTSGIFF